MAVKYTPEERRAVYEEFMLAALRPGDGLIQKWYAEKAAALGVTPATVQNWVVREKEKDFFRGAGRKATVHQLLMHEIDLTSVDAMLTLKKCLSAKRRVFRLNKDGDTVADYYDPDFSAQIQAAEKILKIAGGFAADRIDLSPGDGDASKLTEAELIEELHRVNGQLQAKTLPAPLKTFGADNADVEQRLPEADGSDQA